MLTEVSVFEIDELHSKIAVQVFETSGKDRVFIVGYCKMEHVLYIQYHGLLYTIYTTSLYQYCRINCVFWMPYNPLKG